MDDLKGYDEVFNLLLEHSFRYFGPTAEMTTKITDNSTWNPSPDPSHNSLIKLVDPKLRESNDAYLEFYYIMDYYLFDSFLSKVKYEVENPKNKALSVGELFNLKFDEEELRKVMGNIGHLLLKEQSLISDQTSYDFLNLYFQIKKLWSIIITTRYLNEQVDINTIKMKIQKSFVIKPLQEVARANPLIENYLLSFEEIFKNEEAARKHIDEFLREYLLRYFQYIIIGLTNFQKDFLQSIYTKFTSIDLIKESSNAMNPENAFHRTLIEFLRTNNLQTEKEMEQFIGLIEKQRNELIGVDPEQENSAEQTDITISGLTEGPEETTNLLEDPLQNDLNLNLLLSEDGQTNNNNANDPNLLNDFENFTFSTLTSSTQKEDADNENQLNESMNQENPLDTNQLDVNQLENPIDDPFEQVDNMMSSDVADSNRERPSEDATVTDAEIFERPDEPPGPLPLSQTPDLTKVAQTIKQSNSIQSISTETDQPASAIEPAAANSSTPAIIPLPASLEPVNTSSESLLNRSNSGSNLRKLTELTRLPVEKVGEPTEEDNQIDLSSIQQSINNFENNSELEFDMVSTTTPNYHDMTLSGDKQHPKGGTANESDDLDDLGLGITVKEIASRPTRTSLLSFDFESPPKKQSSIVPDLPLKPVLNKRTAQDDSTDSDGTVDETVKKTNTQERTKKKKTRGRPRKRAQSDASDSDDDAPVEKVRRKKKFAQKEAAAKVDHRESRRSTKKRVQTSEDSTDEEESKRPRLTSNGEAGFATVDQETMKRITSNQPKIIMKPIGQLRHKEKLITIYN